MTYPVPPQSFRPPVHAGAVPSGRGRSGSDSEGEDDDVERSESRSTVDILEHGQQRGLRPVGAPATAFTQAIAAAHQPLPGAQPGPRARVMAMGTLICMGTCLGTSFTGLAAWASPLSSDRAFSLAAVSAIASVMFGACWFLVSPAFTATSQ